jgi:hypothetical protein
VGRPHSLTKRFATHNNEEQGCSPPPHPPAPPGKASPTITPRRPRPRTWHSRPSARRLLLLLALLLLLLLTLLLLLLLLPPLPPPSQTSPLPLPASVNMIRYLFLFTVKRTVKDRQIHGYSQVTVQNCTAIRVKTASKLEN